MTLSLEVRPGNLGDDIIVYPKDRDTVAKLREIGFVPDFSIGRGFALSARFAHRLIYLWDQLPFEWQRNLITNKLLFDQSYAEHPVNSVQIPYNSHTAPEPFGYQIAAAQMASQRKWTLFGHRVGIGKTAAAILTLNTVQPNRVLLVCAAQLMTQWKGELEKWLARQYRIHLVNRTESRPLDSDRTINVVPLSRLSRQAFALRAGAAFDFAIVDEITDLKNPPDLSGQSARAQAMWGGLSGRLGVADKVRQGVLLSATPIPSAPTEMYAMLAATAPHVLQGRSKHAFLHDTVNSEQRLRSNSYGGTSKFTKIVSARNPVALRYDLRATGYLVRPNIQNMPAQWRVISLNANDKVAQLVREDRSLYDRWRSRASLPRKEVIELEGHYMSIRRQLGVIKAQEVAALAENYLQHLNRLVIFFWHTEVADAIARYLSPHQVRVDLVSGKVPVKKRDAVLARFRARYPGRHVICAQITAASKGIDSFVATNQMIIAELPWTSADVEQMVGRLTRRSQTADNVLVTLPLFPGSSEDAVMETLQTRIISSREILS